MDLKTTSRLAQLKAAHKELIPAALTKDELRIVLQIRQCDQMMFAGIDPEFELMFSQSVLDMHKVLAGVPVKPPAPPRKTKAKSTARTKNRPGGDEIVVRNEMGK